MQPEHEVGRLGPEQLPQRGQVGGGEERDGDVERQQFKQTEADPDRSDVFVADGRIGEPVAGQATAEGDHHIGNSSLSPDRSIAVEIDPPIPELAPARVGVLRAAGDLG